MSYESFANMTKSSPMNTSPNIGSTREALQYAAPYIRGKVLDAGGGSTAKYRSLILSHASEYVCLDGRAGGFTDVVGDVMDMPFQEGAFDTVVCNQVLEHVPQPKKVIAESYRVLKPGGHLICTVPFLEASHADPGDYFRYTFQGLETLCREAGFEITHIQPYGGLFSVLYSFIKFSWFSPYRKLSLTEKRLSRWLGNIFGFLDRFSNSKIIYSDVLIIAHKK